MSPVAIIAFSALLEAGLLLTAFHALLPWLGFEPPLWLQVLVIGSWALYELVSFGPKRRALAGPLRFGTERRTGRRGVALTRIEADGRVQVDREIWKARCEEGAVEAGEEVEIVRREQMRLVVRRPPPVTPTDG